MPGEQFTYPSDLAEFVRDWLRSAHRRSPALASLRKLLEIAFFASMKTEEAESVRCTLVYMNPDNPDPRVPARIVADRWRYVRLDQRIPLSVRNLVKISKSFDPIGAAVAVYANDEGPFIWGAIDQQGQRMSFIARERDDGAETPGLLEISIVGRGSLEVHKDYTMIAALRQGTLAIGDYDVLETPGPIRTALQPAIEELVERVRDEVGEATFSDRDHWAASIAEYWTTTLARILLTIQRYGHGGALVLLPNARNTGLVVKYPIDYDRLADALFRISVHTIRATAADDKIHGILDDSIDDLPVGLFLEKEVAGNDRDETEDEVTGCVRLIASLSRVDGAVVLNRAMNVRGYGAIFRVETEPNGVYVAQDVAGTVARLKRINPKHFGTRHQSMMRICFRRTGAVGFVVSQDGDVRAMTRVRNRLMVWEDVKLKLS